MHAATVALINGDRLTGQLLRLTDDTLVFKSPVFGEVSIPWKQVQSLVSEDEVRVQLQDGIFAAEKMVVEENGKMQIKTGGDGSPRILSRHDLVALNPPIMDDGVQYSGHVNLGGTFNRGNATTNQYNLVGELIARRPDDRYTFGVELNEASSQNVQTASDRRLTAQYDAFLLEKKFLFLNAKLKQDEPAALDLRTSLGAGYGYQFRDTDITKLSGQVGLNYVHENYTVLEDRTFPTFSVGLKYKQKLLNEKLVYSQNLEMDVNLKNSQDILLRANFGMGLPLSKSLSVNTQLNVDYDKLPADDKKTTDMALIFSVGYGF